ncbi:thermonuclease family protein [Hyphomonas sp.]|uniref:thermonuclease family protein n=1 Tax=Hyphomonas sp. TaxID=87 RepID=UPI00391BDD62
MQIGERFGSTGTPQMAASSSRATAALTRSDTLVDVNWVDGDSGTLNGRSFRLHGVDAPEGSPSRAECVQEQVRAEASAGAARALTRNGKVTVRQSHGFDRYGRELVSLSVDGRDVATLLMEQGHLKRWDYPAQRKPNWC